MSENNNTDLNEVFEEEMDDSTVITVPIDETLSNSGEAADAAAVGAALAQKADKDELPATIKVNGQQADNQGLILINGTHIPVSGTNQKTLAEAITEIEQETSGKTAANIPMSSEQGAETISEAISGIQEDVTELQNAIDGMEEKTAANIPMETGSTTTVKSAMETLDRKAVKSVNRKLPDAAGDVDLSVVPLAENLQSDKLQSIEGEFIIRTTGGNGSVSDGKAYPQHIYGNSRHDGYVAEELNLTVIPITRTEPDEPITATIDRDTFVAAVDESSIINLYYTTEWSEDPEDYGVTVTGEPVAGDQITIVYVKEQRGTIIVADPDRLVGTGWNLFNANDGYARVVKYSDVYGYKIGGTYTSIAFSDTLTGDRTSLLPNANGLFNVPGDGYVFVTGGNATDTYILATWSDWTEGPSTGYWEAYRESGIDLSAVVETYFPYGMLKIGTVRDEIDLVAKRSISRIERIVYSEENRAAAAATGRSYDFDENNIYIVREESVQNAITIGGEYSVSEHGMEWFTETELPLDTEILYGKNLRDKLERDVLTISQQTLAEEEKAQVRQNIGVMDPPTNGNGTLGQLLKTNGDGTTEWTTQGTPTDAQVGTAVSAWLEAHPEATTTVEDGAISRAKLNDDLKAKTDAVPVLNSALNAESAFLQDAIWDASGNRPIQKIQGKVVNIGSSTVDITDLVDRSGFACSIISCSPGDTFTITASGYGNYRSYGFVKSDGTTRIEASGSGVNLNKEIKIAPANAAYLVINDSSNSASFYGVMLNTDELKSITMQPSGNLFDPLSDQIITGKCIYTNGVETATEGYLISAYIPVSGGVRYYLLDCLPSSDTRMAATYDEKFNVLSTKAFASDQYIDTPASAKYLRLSLTEARRYIAQVKTDNSSDYIPYRDKRYARMNMFALDYVPGKTYSKDEIVTYNGCVYIANTNNTDEAFNVSHWDKYDSIVDMINGQRLSIASDSKAVKFADNAFSKKGSTVSANATVELNYANIAKNVIYELCCKFTSAFNSITIGKGTSGTKYASWVTIDTEKITTYLDLGDSTPRTSVFNHGLTIADFLNVRIETTDEYTCYVEIQTNGATYRTPSTGRFYGNCYAKHYFTPTNAITEYSFSVIFRDAMKPIWLFGDSYMSFTDDRWVYYLKGVNQFNNVLINACSGITSGRTIVALRALKGKPKFALWALGMNDPSDTDIDTPATNWMNNVNEFLSWCIAHECTPVFGTIPTTPDYERSGQTIAGKYNEGKNKWIRNSGYRYIDFAKAYGADAEGNWYTGMLTEGDWVHPTALGAKAAFHRALADFPEIMGAL